MKHFETIDCLQDALDYNGETLDQFNARTVFDTDGQKAGKELEVIAKALNNGKVLSYKDTNVKKCYPVFTAVGSGSGFGYSDYLCDRSTSFVGARLCVEDAKTVTYFGKQFIGIWDRYING